MTFSGMEGACPETDAEIYAFVRVLGASKVDV